ncbi:hypothetical protein L195_g026448 [Trifolium pratense]|uniref:Uncharacterized protein n=1 Tax=Trifolium pratense TaxID=57577 RepID=A0A2K3NJA5_TRIPR|nr:hypothetical protein L195_g026448 [Trifolium pratense]
MLGKGVSREHFQPRTCSTRKNTSKTGRAKLDLENIVYIDLDCDQFDDVEMIDCPDAVLQNLCGFSGPIRDRTSTPHSVISINDDDVDHSGIDVDGVGELDSDASSNKRTALRNRYGLYGSEIESSDSDCSDCEVIKREQWEKVSAKRKGRVFNERASSFGLHRNNYNNIEVENKSQRHGKGPLYGPSSSNYVKENQSSFTVKDDIRHGEKATREKVSSCPNSENSNFCNGFTGSSRLEKVLGDEESKFMSSNDMEVDDDESQLNAHDRQVDSDESPLRNKNDNIFEGNSNGASFDKMNYNGHEFELHTQDADIPASNRSKMPNVSKLSFTQVRCMKVWHKYKAHVMYSSRKNNAKAWDCGIYAMLLKVANAAAIAVRSGFLKWPLPGAPVRRVSHIRQNDGYFSSFLKSASIVNCKEEKK